MVRVTYINDSGAETAEVELDDFTVKTLHPTIAEMLQGAATTQVQPSPTFELSGRARTRRAKNRRRIKS
jgi:hypothetical protein